MVIIIGNQKGGAGKSTLTVLLANYLSQMKKRRVTVLDMDYQQSVASKAEKAKILENIPDYEVVPADLKHFGALQQVLSSKADELVLIDLPGKMDDDSLISVFKAADIVLCPFAYDEFTVDSTLLFAMVLRKINPKAPLVFIPNRIKNTVKYETRSEVDKVLTRFGAVTAAISDRVDFQRLTTVYIPVSVHAVILPVFELIYENYIQEEAEP